MNDELKQEADELATSIHSLLVDAVTDAFGERVLVHLDGDTNTLTVRMGICRIERQLVPGGTDEMIEQAVAEMADVFVGLLQGAISVPQAMAHVKQVVIGTPCESTYQQLKNKMADHKLIALRDE